MNKILSLAAGCLIVSCLAGCADNSQLKELPAPEPEEGLRGEQFGIDRNINEKTIDEYLNRGDTIYRDMRMLKDEAQYEAIGGDSWLSGYVEGFEIVPYPYLVNVEGLPDEVGASYSGPTLFTHSQEGYTANYDESMDILEYLFPKDRNIILMCGGGGYAGMTKNMLKDLGWDETKIWNAGGFWFYEGKNAVTLKHEENGTAYYDFYKAPYHFIDFTSLHPADGYDPSVTPSPGNQTAKETLRAEKSGEEVKQMMADKQTFALSLYLPGCSSCIGFAPVAKEYGDAGLIEFYSMNFNEAAKVEGLAENISYTPAVILVSDGEVTAVLRPDSDDDLPYFRSTSALSEWFHEHAGLPLYEGNQVNDDTECHQEGCRVEFESEQE